MSDYQINFEEEFSDIYRVGKILYRKSAAAPN